MATREPIPETETVPLWPHAGTRLGIGRTLAYRLARTGGLPVPVLRLGRRLVVPRAALDRALRLEADRARVGDDAT